MRDAADHLAASIRLLINESVQAALRVQPTPSPAPESTPDSEPPTQRMLYPIREVQQKLGVSRTMVYQLLSDGQLPSVTIGRRRFVTAAALSAFVKRLT
jgi:excisionase family DNA binding protein